MTHTLLIDLGPNILSFGGRLMAACGDIKAKLDDLSATVDAEKTEVLAAISALEAKIADVVTPDQLAELTGEIDAVKAKVQGIVEPPAQPV